MRPLAFANVFLLLGGSAFARPPANAGVDGCCCCDVSVTPNVISCNPAIPASDCFCAAVACPDNASTVWVSSSAQTPAPTPTPTPTPVPTPAPEEKLEPCCCCNIGIPATVCKLKPRWDCFCVAVECPAGAPTTTIAPTPTPY